MHLHLLAPAVCATLRRILGKEMQVFDLAVLIAETAVGESAKNSRTRNHSKP